MDTLEKQICLGNKLFRFRIDSYVKNPEEKRTNSNNSHLAVDSLLEALKGAEKE